jgi:uncharacterized membrane protein
MTDNTRRHDRVALIAALLGLVALYAVWFHADKHRVASLLVFALPPLLLALGALARRRTAPFWAGVFALAWFSHGVMSAWTHPETRVFALIEVALALVVVFAGNATGLRARFGKRAAGGQAVEEQAVEEHAVQERAAEERADRDPR